MWKQFLSLARGQRYEAAGAVLNLQAHVILRQQLRDVAATLERARLALAVVVAQEREEERRLGAATLRLADLEERATAALDGGHTALAREAAEMIARLEADQQTSCDTKTALGSEIQRLRLFVTDAESRLVALQRGQRLAEAAGRVGRLRQIEPSGVEASLRDAEATLKLLRERQGEAEAIDRALDEMASEADPGTLSRRLAEAGCGSPVPHSAEAVLKRLDARRRPAGI